MLSLFTSVLGFVLTALWVSGFTFYVFGRDLFQTMDHNKFRKQQSIRPFATTTVFVGKGIESVLITINCMISCLIVLILASVLFIVCSIISHVIYGYVHDAILAVGLCSVVAAGLAPYLNLKFELKQFGNGLIKISKMFDVWYWLLIMTFCISTFSAKVGGMSGSVKIKCIAMMITLSPLAVSLLTFIIQLSKYAVFVLDNCDARLLYSRVAPKSSMFTVVVNGEEKVLSCNKFYPIVLLDGKCLVVRISSGQLQYDPSICSIV